MVVRDMAEAEAVVVNIFAKGLSNLLIIHQIPILFLFLDTEVLLCKVIIILKSNTTKGVILLMSNKTVGICFIRQKKAMRLDLDAEKKLLCRFLGLDLLRNNNHLLIVHYST